MLQSLLTSHGNGPPGPGGIKRRESSGGRIKYTERLADAGI